MNKLFKIAKKIKNYKAIKLEKIKKQEDLKFFGQMMKIRKKMEVIQMMIVILQLIQKNF